jgi:hypothetical protein
MSVSVCQTSLRHSSLTEGRNSAVEEDIHSGAGHHSHSEAAARRSHHRHDVAGQDSKTWRLRVCVKSRLGDVLRVLAEMPSNRE